jgi:hypothetical protein
MRNTTDVTGGKPIAVWSLSISGVSVINLSVAFYDIRGRKGELLFFCSVPDTIRDEIKYRLKSRLLKNTNRKYFWRIRLTDSHPSLCYGWKSNIFIKYSSGNIFLIKFDVSFITVLAFPLDSVSFTVHCQLVIYHSLWLQRKHGVWVRVTCILFGSNSITKQINVNEKKTKFSYFTDSWKFLCQVIVDPSWCNVFGRIVNDTSLRYR